MQQLDVPVTLLTGGFVSGGFRSIPPEATPLTASRGTEKLVPGGALSARVGASVVATTAPVGCYLAIQGEAPGAPGVWDYLDGVDGPKLAIDSASLDLLDANTDESAWVVAGEWVTIRTELQSADVRYRAVIVGGSGTEDVIVSELTVWLGNVAVTLPPPDEEAPPEFDPGSCDTPSPQDVTDHDSQVEPSGATWSDDGTTVTLTLDGSGSGPASQTKTFTGLEPGQLYTYYLTVDPSVAGLGAYLSVGSDTATATGTDSQTLVARDEADGSGNLVVSWGVPDVSAAPDSASTSDLDYASRAAAEGDGWTVTPGDGSITFGSGHAITGSGVGTSIKLSVVDSGTGPKLEHTYSVVSGHSYRVTVWSELDGGWWHPGTLTVVSGGNLAADSVNGGVTRQMSATVTADGTSLYVKIENPRSSLFGGTANLWVSALTIDGLAGGGATTTFTALGSCLGSGLGTGGSGLGDDGDDPIPPTPPGGYPDAPEGGARPFTCSNLPPEGFGFWNGTIEGLTITSAPNVFNTARTAGARLFIAPVGLGGRVFDSAGRFSLSLWKAQLDAFHADPRANAALEEAIADGTAFRHYLIDEPDLVRRWGRVVTFAEVEQMCLYSRGYWPTWRIAIRVDPTNPWMVRTMSGLTDMWAQYTLVRGDVTTYRDGRIAAAKALGHGLVIGLNIHHFTVPNGGRAATPSEIQHYGGILAASCETTAFNMWQFNSTDYAQPGEPAAIQASRNTFAAYDP